MVPDKSLLGFHASIAGGLDRAPDRIKELDCPTGQIFTSNNRQWAIPELDEDEAELFRQESNELTGGIVAHACYLINLAKSDQDAWEKSVLTLRKEVERADKLGMDYLVLHPGSHVGNGEEMGLARIVEALNRVLEETKDADAKILPETMAGQGTALGYKLEHLLTLQENTDRSERIKFCIDTCHLHAGGYDLRTESSYEKTMQEVENVLGLDDIKVIHLNDSREPHDSRVDRHENIGEGTIGETGFRCLMNDKRWHNVPKILETPVDEDWRTDYGRNLDRLVDLLE